MMLTKLEDPQAGSLCYGQCDRLFSMTVGCDGALFELGIDQVVEHVALTSFIAKLFNGESNLVKRQK